ncbi:MAG: hypothetical protein M3Z05_19675 [Gemmatimonadota bacterium]|nr:hypothetical protein [Gemmatimonadota bacterium]
MPKSTKFIYALAFLALPAVAHAQAAGTETPAQKRAEMKHERKEMKKEAHPELHAAMTALERSKKDLEKTANDYGGHKTEAMKSIDEAMKHLKLAETFDKK